MSEARKEVESEVEKARRGIGVTQKAREIKLGVLRMAPQDSLGSYNSQHPVDVAAALTSYDPATKIGILCFSMPHFVPTDK